MNIKTNKFTINRKFKHFTNYFKQKLLNKMFSVFKKVSYFIKLMGNDIIELIRFYGG